MPAESWARSGGPRVKSWYRTRAVFHMVPLGEPKPKPPPHTHTHTHRVDQVEHRWSLGSWCVCVCPRCCSGVSDREEGGGEWCLWAVGGAPPAHVPRVSSPVNGCAAGLGPRAASRSLNWKWGVQIHFFFISNNKIKKDQYSMKYVRSKIRRNVPERRQPVSPDLKQTNKQTAWGLKLQNKWWIKIHLGRSPLVDFYSWTTNYFTHDLQEKPTDYNMMTIWNAESLVTWVKSEPDGSHMTRQQPITTRHGSGIINPPQTALEDTPLNRLFN